MLNSEIAVATSITEAFDNVAVTETRAMSSVRSSLASAILAHRLNLVDALLKLCK